MSERFTLSLYDDDDTVFVYDRRAGWFMEKPEEREATVTEDELLRQVRKLREQLAAAQREWTQCAEAAADHRAEADALRADLAEARGEINRLRVRRRQIDDEAYAYAEQIELMRVAAKDSADRADRAERILAALREPSDGVMQAAVRDYSGDIQDAIRAAVAAAEQEVDA